MNPLHEQFVLEARELIQQAVDDLLAIERQGASAEAVDRVFRAFHTLKGGAGVVELPAMGHALHAAEDLLAAIKAGRVALTAAVVDQALACLDHVSAWVDEFDASETEPADAGDVARHVATGLHDLLMTPAEKAAAAGASDATKSGKVSEEGSSGKVATAAPPGAALGAWVATVITDPPAPLAAALRDRALLAIAYEPRPDCFFNGDDPVGLMRQIPNLLALHIAPRTPWPPLADADPFACNLRLHAITSAERPAIATLFRFVSDQVTLVPIPSTALPKSRKGLIQAVLAEQRRLLLVPHDPTDIAGCLGAAARVIANALRHDRAADLAGQAEAAGADALARRAAAPLLAFLDTLLSAPQAPVQPAAARPPAGDADRSAGRSLRVEETKIDALVNLAGELIVAKNSFAHLAKRADEIPGGQELARALRREHAAIERLAGEMHGAAMQLRMVPVAQVFRRLPRLVRDMSQKLGKAVDLRTDGETTEADKGLVDLLFEPLLHLVRNALDHGIEDPKQRGAAGKPQSATLKIQAHREGERFILEVADDGRGIDPAAIRRKAAERKLATEEALSALSDAEAIDLIFTAGFSTAVAVSDISGRGVGMDVVRTMTEQMGGRVSVSSRVGIGTTVRLALPLNIAVSRIMVVEAGAQLFGIPMDAVTETVRLPPERISRIKNNDGFVLRDRIVPICRLASLMGLPDSNQAGPAQMRLFVVTETGGRIAAIEVDAVRDRLEVVLKPMQGFLADASAYAGTTLLGDGSVLLVLDLKEILP